VRQWLFQKEKQVSEEKEHAGPGKVILCRLPLNVPSVISPDYPIEFAPIAGTIKER